MKLVMIDNYDSFTYNLVQYFGQLGCELHVYRNDRVTIGEIEKFGPDKIVVSPGPCTPLEAGISKEVIRIFSERKYLYWEFVWAISPSPRSSAARWYELDV